MMACDVSPVAMFSSACLFSFLDVIDIKFANESLAVSSAPDPIDRMQNA